MAYQPNPQAAFDDFEDRPLVMVLLGENATVRVWLSDKIETPEQHAWALDQLDAARRELQAMSKSEGEAMQ